MNSKTAVLTVLLIVLLAAAAQAAPQKQQPPTRTSLSEVRKAPPTVPTEDEKNIMGTKTEIHDPSFINSDEHEDLLKEKYAKVEQKIRDSWADSDSLDPHELDPNHPSFKNADASVKHDSYYEGDDNEQDDTLTDEEVPVNVTKDSDTMHEEIDHVFPVLDLNADNHTSLFAAIHHNSSSNYFILYGYRKTDCESCAAHLAQFVDVCNTVLETERETRMHLRHFRCGYWDVDTALPKDRRLLHSFNPHYSWRAPFAVVIHLDGHNHGSEFAHPLDIHYDKFPSDLTHALRRHKAHEDVPIVVGEHQLLDTIFDTHTDGVTLVLFHDHTDIKSIVANGKGRALDYFRRVRNEERGHVHFTSALYEMGEVAPEWTLEYNPENADVVAFIANPDGKHFQTATFNFSHCDGQWDNYKGMLELREFVDEMKGYRHAHTGRRFRGIKKIRHYEVIEEATEHAVTEDLGDRQVTDCSYRVEEGDEITVHVVGTSLDFDTPFVNMTASKIVAGSVPHLPPIAQHIFTGMCKGEKKEVYIPPHHGFHAEHYLVELVDFHVAPGNRRRAASSAEDEQTATNQQQQPSSGSTGEL